MKMSNSAFKAWMGTSFVWMAVSIVAAIFFGSLAGAKILLFAIAFWIVPTLILCLGGVDD